jgi:hypothetical protein
MNPWVKTRAVCQDLAHRLERTCRMQSQNLRYVRIRIL